MADEGRKGEIYAELNRMKEVAQKMRDIAAGLKRLANEDYANGITAVQESWTGDSASAFLVKAQKAGTETEKAATELSAAADTLETIAADYAEAELKAIEIAQS